MFLYLKNNVRSHAHHDERKHFYWNNGSCVCVINSWYNHWKFNELANIRSFLQYCSSNSIRMKLEWLLISWNFTDDFSMPAIYKNGVCFHIFIHSQQRKHSQSTFVDREYLFSCDFFQTKYLKKWILKSFSSSLHFWLQWLTLWGLQLASRVSILKKTV